MKNDNNPPNDKWLPKYTPPKPKVSDITRGKGKTKLPDFNKLARKTLILAGEELERVLKDSEYRSTLDQKTVEHIMDLNKLTTSILSNKNYILEPQKSKPKSSDIIDETLDNIDIIAPTHPDTGKKIHFIGDNDDDDIIT